jgi:hypothetical protein
MDDTKSKMRERLSIQVMKQRAEQACHFAADQFVS